MDAVDAVDAVLAVLSVLFSVDGAVTAGRTPLVSPQKPSPRFTFLGRPAGFVTRLRPKCTMVGGTHRDVRSTADNRQGAACHWRGSLCRK